VAPLRVEARGIAKAFGPRNALQGADLAAAPGEVTVILGPSGAGKSTLLRVLALLLAPAAGELRLDGAPAVVGDEGLRARIGWVGQKPLVFRASAQENVAFGLAARGVPVPEREARARPAMEELGIWALRDQPARRLSGGEQQRVAFARALVLQPDLLLLDEATANLDPANVGLLEREVRRVAERGAAVVATTHDLAQARRVADRVALLLRGRVVEEAPVKEFFEAPRTREARVFVRGELVG
jgi:tungstate transport system ATP-binding protein